MRDIENGVSLCDCEDYDPALLDRAMEAHFADLQADGLLRPGIKAVLKPNLVMKRRPEEATTTHPAVVAAVVRVLRKRGVEHITLADSPGGLYNPGVLSALYASTGMKETAGAEGFSLNLDTGFQNLRAEGAVRCHSFDIINPLAEADLIINLCKLKTHAMTGLSGACKNMFGAVPGLKKPELHCQFPDRAAFGEMLVDLCCLTRPALTIVDAVECMEGNGPTGGSRRHMGLTLAGRNPFSLDLILCRLIGVEPRAVSTCLSAIERGLCPDSPDKVETAGDPVSDYAAVFQPPDSRSVDFTDRAPGFLRRPAAALFKRAAPKPVVRRSDCVGCGKCAESCPQHIITLIDRKAHIQYRRCIRCYCCHEMCPVRAIDLKRFALFR
ncbi:MAG: DUF362 domain-containing protein [Clostridiales bacterium]|nr:DUF362 domain-containing protein [Clostridiales bacterium]